MDVRIPGMSFLPADAHEEGPFRRTFDYNYLWLDPIITPLGVLPLPAPYTPSDELHRRTGMPRSISTLVRYIGFDQLNTATNPLRRCRKACSDSECP